MRYKLLYIWVPFTFFVSLASAFDKPFEIFSFNENRFPSGPNERLTPGDKCDRPDEIRYPEGIPYCSRSVNGETKSFVIQTYDAELGYSIGSMSRGDFKIDHYIPLCAGGSNDKENLWPQHKSVYVITDPLEFKLCEQMSKGKLSQAKAFQYIRTAKKDLRQVPSILQALGF